MTASLHLYANPNCCAMEVLIPPHLKSRGNVLSSHTVVGVDLRFNVAHHFKQVPQHCLSVHLVAVLDATHLVHGFLIYLHC